MVRLKAQQEYVLPGCVRRYHPGHADPRGDVPYVRNGESFVKDLQWFH